MCLRVLSEDGCTVQCLVLGNLVVDLLNGLWFEKGVSIRKAKGADVSLRRARALEMQRAQLSDGRRLMSDIGFPAQLPVYPRGRRMLRGVAYSAVNIGYIDTRIVCVADA